MNAGEVVLAGFRDFGARWKEQVSVVAILVLPVSVLGLIVLVAVAPDVLGDMIGKTLTPDELGTAFRAVPASEWIRFGIVAAVFALVSGIANAVALGACLSVERAHLNGSSLTTSDALKEGLARAGSLIWIFSLAALPVMVGLILCVLPGVWLIVSWLVAPVVLFHEGLKGRRALARSYRLVKPLFWPTLLVGIIEFVGLGVIQSAVTALPETALAPVDGMRTLPLMVVMLASTIAGLITLGLHACIVTRLFTALVERESRPISGSFA